MTHTSIHLVTRFVDEIWNSGNFQILDKLVDVNYSVDGQQVGRNWVEANVTSFRSAFPDLSVTIVSLIAEGEQVAALLRIRGTHMAEWRGIPATGNRVDYREAAFWTIQDGLISSGEFVAEALTLRIQLGRISPSVWQAAPSRDAKRS